MLCGQFATGKTTISKIITAAVKQLSTNSTSAKEHSNNSSNSMVMLSNKSTIGVDVIPIEVNATTFVGKQHKSNTAAEEEEEDYLHLQIWDFAGNLLLLILQ